MESIDFSYATLRDIDPIMEMEAHGFASGNRECREAYEARIRTFPEGSLMAYFGAECIGCIFSEIWQASASPLAEYFALGHDILERHDIHHGTELYISSMTIAPAFRGIGLGTPLLLGCIDRVTTAFPQISSVLLLVNENWKQARNVYQAAGFQELVRFNHFFNPKDTLFEDGIVMRRLIKID